MPAYKFLGISESGYKNFKKADCLNCKTQSKTTFNDKLFDNVPVDSYFVFDYSRKHPESSVKIITEEDIPDILFQDELDEKEAKEAYEKKRSENIATGRFKYYYTDFREGKAENIIETLSENYDDFYQALADAINSKSWHSSDGEKYTVKDIKNNPRITEFMDEARIGDKFGWYSWNGGFLAYSAGPCIIRDDKVIASQAWIVS